MPIFAVEQFLIFYELPPDKSFMASDYDQNERPAKQSVGPGKLSPSKKKLYLILFRFNNNSSYGHVRFNFWPWLGRNFGVL